MILGFVLLPNLKLTNSFWGLICQINACRSFPLYGITVIDAQLNLLLVPCECKLSGWLALNFKCTYVRTLLHTDIYLDQMGFLCLMYVMKGYGSIYVCIPLCIMCSVGHLFTIYSARYLYIIVWEVSLRKRSLYRMH